MKKLPAALSDEEAHAGEVEHGQHRHAPPLAGQTTENESTDDAAVDGQTAIPDSQHIPDGIIIIRCHRHIIQAGAGDAQHHADEDDVHHRVASGLRVRTKGWLLPATFGVRETVVERRLAFEEVQDVGTVAGRFAADEWQSVATGDP